MAQRNRPAWQGSTRREELPPNWEQLRAEGRRRNPRQVCHWCRRPGGTTFDHKIPRSRWPRDRAGRLMPGLDDPENLDWIHDWRDVQAGRSRRNCHGEKTGQEAAASRVPLNRPEETHPAFR